MAEFADGIDYTLVAAADLSGMQYRGVLVASAANGSTSGRTLVCSQAGDPVIGVLQNKPSAAGRPARVRGWGESKAIAGGPVTAGDILRVNAAGFFVTGNSGYVAGTALTGCASGGLFSMAVHIGQATA